MHKRTVECTKENDENNETPAVKRRAESGPQDSPRLPSQKLYTSLFELVPQACLFAIVEKPVLLNQTENETPSLPLLSSSEQPTQQDDVQSDIVTSPIPPSYIAQGVREEEEPASTHLSVDQPDHSKIQLRLLPVEDSTTSECNGQPSGCHMNDNSESNDGHVSSLDVESTNGRNISSSEETASSSRSCSKETVIPYSEEVTNALPLPLPEYFKKHSLIHKDRGLPNTAEQLFISLTISKKECSEIEHATRNQRTSADWHQQRQGRLTASAFHTIFGMRKQTDRVNVAKRLLSKTDISHIPAIQWGISKEDTAKREYIREMSSHSQFEYTTAGLVVNPLFPHLGASPDGFVECSCCGKGLVEIKCPFTAKDLYPDAIRGK